MSNPKNTLSLTTRQQYTLAYRITRLLLQFPVAHIRKILGADMHIPLSVDILKAASKSRQNYLLPDALSPEYKEFVQEGGRNG